MDKRAAGILMPITSLPSEYGIGCFSKSAYDFVDWLKEAGQSYWQILPLGPTSYGDSPYQSFSTFAGNPYFISLKALVEEGVLTKEDCEKVNWGKRADSVDYEKIYKGRYPLLRKAYEREDLYDAALVIAALAAEGVTRIRGCSFIERGYEHICEDLTALGGLLIKDRGTL